VGLSCLPAHARFTKKIVVGVPPLEGQALQTFYDETCFSCPAGTMLMTTAVVDVPVPDPTF